MEVLCQVVPTIVRLVQITENNWISKLIFCAIESYMHRVNISDDDLDEIAMFQCEGRSVSRQTANNHGC